MADGVKIRIIGDNSDFRKKMQGVGTVAQQGFKVAAAAAVTFGAVAVKQITDLAAETREYREDLARLEAAFTTAGFTSEQATAIYKDFYAVLGEEDRSVEAVNHLAQLCDTEEQLNKWTTICTGVVATFGDSLPIEGLTEAANETAKVGQVTGPLADALNWAGVSEDEFNKKLAACTSEQERQALITETLNGIYEDAANKYREVNASVMDANRAQSDYQDTLAALGETVEPIMTALKIGWTNVLGALLEMVEGVDVEAYAQKIVDVFGYFVANILPLAINKIGELITVMKKLTPIILAVVAAIGAWKAGLMISGTISAVSKVIQTSTGIMKLYADGAKIATIFTSGFSTAQKIMGTVMAIATGKISLMTAAQAALNAVMSANPIGIIIIAIGALVAAFVVLWNKSEAFRNFWIELWEEIKLHVQVAWEIITSIFSVAWDYIKSIWDNAKPYFIALWEAIKTVFSVVVEVLGGFFSAAWNAIKFIWDTVQPYFLLLWEGIKSIFSVVAAVLSGDFSAAWEAIKSVWGVAVSFFSAIWEGIKLVFSKVRDWFADKFGTAWAAIKNIWNAAKSFFGNIWEGIKSIFVGENGVVSRFKQWFSDAFDKVKEFFSLDNFKKVFEDSIIGGLENIKDAVEKKAGEIWDKISGVLKNPFEFLFDWGGEGGSGGGGGYGGIGNIVAYGPGISFPKLSGFSGPNSHRNGNRRAMDYPAPMGTPIPAIIPGEIVSVRSLNYSYGKHVVIQGMDGKRYVYAHMSRFANIKPGMMVPRGKIIGYVGSTGNSSGPHLHYGLMGYQSGGFPFPGELFVANENGIEMMGKMGSRNVVANNMQIIDGIKNGVFSGMVRAARARGISNYRTNNVTINQHFYKENVSPSDTKRAARKAVKIGLVGGKT
ncbi:MAG TPA: peptidoglycan DD-metalloendopeptidase family protein [Firmicutes bacterium]|nr:peptidoglycan DD-metalloendopeptidase family protein [Bacillota bacterium]